MSKTAEEILVEHRVFMTTDTTKTFNLNMTRDCGVGTSKWIMESMNEFAAQEVEAYKASLKKYIAKHHGGAHISYERMVRIIDTVK